ncbi:hypothetical protein DICA2_D23948 [Diutina catenulata]
MAKVAKPKTAGKKFYYAVARGRSVGVFHDWPTCKQHVDGFAGAKYKKFPTSGEAHAFVEEYAGHAAASSVTQPSSTSKPAASKKTENLQNSLPSRPTPSLEFVDEIYTDGACRGNGQRAMAMAGIGVFYGDGDPRNIGQALYFVDNCHANRPTNQRAELCALRYAMMNIGNDIRAGKCKGVSRIHTDSTYSLKCMMQWWRGWERNNYRNSKGQPVVNQDLIKPMVELLKEINAHYESQGWRTLPIVHVKGHADSVGNNQADELANRGADQMEQYLVMRGGGLDID